MNIKFFLSLRARQTCRSEQETVMFVPFLGEITRSIVTIHPNRKGKSSVAFGKGAPSISNLRVGE